MRHARAAQLMVVLSRSIIGAPSTLTSVRSTFMDLCVLQDYKWMQSRFKRDGVTQHQDFLTWDQP